MHIGPILSAMRRNKVGAFLIGLQMAMTLAILGNSAFIVAQRVSLMARPSGIDEADLFVMTVTWSGQLQDIEARQLTDLAALRGMPGVVDAYASNSYPMRGSGWNHGVKLDPNQVHSILHNALYFADEHGLNTLGARLVAGRYFRADEIGVLRENDLVKTTEAVMSKALAERLFPGQSALGKTVYYSNGPVTIIGIVDRLQSPWVAADSPFRDEVEYSVLWPYRFISTSYEMIVRTQPGQLDAVMREAPQKLYAISRQRVLDRIKPFSQIRAEAYGDDRGLAIVLGVVCASLVAVTTFGIVGLTSFWVAQRRRQIGVRRALGATRQAILGYFQTENAIIAGAGAVVGIALSVGLNLWMVSSFEMSRIGALYVLLPALAVVLLGQFAVLWPALRAASIPPALATRAA